MKKILGMWMSVLFTFTLLAACSSIHNSNSEEAGIIEDIETPYVYETPNYYPGETNITENMEISCTYEIPDNSSEEAFEEANIIEAMVISDISDITGLAINSESGRRFSPAERIVFRDLFEVFRWMDHLRRHQAQSAWAIVRVIDTQLGYIEDSFAAGRILEGQTSTVEVLIHLHGDTVESPFVTHQFLSSLCIHNERSILLRTGGVYVMPLQERPDWGYWRIISNLDFLFEVDDSGNIYSHSTHPEMNKYNGLPLSVLLEDINYVYMNPILYSAFARQWFSPWQRQDFVVEGNRITMEGSSRSTADWIEGRGIATLDENGRIVAEDENNLFYSIHGMTIEEVRLFMQSAEQNMVTAR